MNKYFLSFIFSLGLFNLQAQNNSDCQLRKIIIYQPEFKSLNQVEDDTTRKTSFLITYQNKKISQIQIERNFTSFEKSKETVSFINRGNKTYLLTEKDTLYIFEYNKAGKPQKIISLNTRIKQESFFEYDNQNRLTKEIRKGGVTDDLKIRFFYENEKEIKKILKGESGFGEFSQDNKYVSVLDDKKNPFYQQYELAYLISDISAHFPNNIILDYHLSDDLSVSKRFIHYTFNSRNLPLEAKEYMYYFNSDNQLFQQRTVFEYACGE